MDADTPLSRWEDRCEIPLFAASVIYLAAYAVHVLAASLPRPVHVLLLAVLAAMWAFFAVDYVVRVRLSGRRFGPAYVRDHVVDTVSLVLPLLRPLRIVHLYEVVQRRRDEPRLSLYGRVVAYAGLSAVLLGFSAALAVYHQERGAKGASIRTFGDALWWACQTLTTVGYGDVVPVTAGGRAVAAGMMALSLGLLGAVTGAFSSWLIQTFAREDEQPPAR